MALCVCACQLPHQSLDDFLFYIALAFYDKIHANRFIYVSIFWIDNIFMIKNEIFWHETCTCKVPFLLCLLVTLFLFRGNPLISLLHVLAKIFYTCIGRYSYWFMRYIKEIIALWTSKDESRIHSLTTLLTIFSS